MLAKLITFFFIFSNIYILSCFAEDGNLFKVPLEIRAQNRPKRLVDDVNDPDLVKLKSLQDKFFFLVGNSSLGQEFKGFNQILRLIDSQAGIELGRLFLNGIMIGVGKEQSSQLLTEFLDDFQYRVPPNFADALVDYTDFIKSVDLKMIPLTIQMLFKKDVIGNSLAQMPLGQLVDLIQPEASKYGIDVRNFINGIIGKEDSTFPELVRKMIHNLNMSSLMNSMAKSFTEGISETDGPNKLETVENKRPRKDQTLMLFKPLVTKLLKENEIDLEADAVIQVLTPFLSSWGHSLQGLMSSMQNNGKDFNFAQLLPLLGMLSSQMKQDNKGTKNEGGNILEAAMSMMGNIGKNNKNMDAILSLASQFIDNGNHDKSSKAKGPGIDMAALLQMAQGLMGNSGNNGMDILSTLTNKDSNIDPQKIMEMASNLIGGIAKTKNDVTDSQSKTKIGKQTETKKGKYFSDALEQFLLRIQGDKKSHTKIKDAVAFIKHMLALQDGALDEIKTRMQDAFRPLDANIDNDIEALFATFSYSKEEWNTFSEGLMDKEFKKKLVQNTLQPVTDIVLLVASDEFQKRQNTFLNLKSKEMFASMGLKGVTINNFPERLEPHLSMVSRGWGLPVNVETLLVPLRNSLKEIWPWYLQNVQKLSSLQKKEVESVVAQSLERDVASPLSALWRISEASRSSASSCLPRAVCRLTRGIPADQQLKSLFTQLASISYGGFRANKDQNFLLFVQVARAAVFKGDCEKYFPIECPKDYFTEDEDAYVEDDDEEVFEQESIPHQEL